MDHNQITFHFHLIFTKLIKNNHIYIHFNLMKFTPVDQETNLYYMSIYLQKIEKETIREKNLGTIKKTKDYQTWRR